ncbi:hypothetical protein P168DRAFT_305643 [Aspergillus campestris IBT 28561]|uniref:Uncharacterized protein n=1 Tax=Aspergillus campestris (strain IBT 28561) TaxID=1392248 RepID=A0A2I1D0F9_ASPC2|nr:uncharacterized protein P168DRAFT_305643 [Aspergillus campestris IBT 28561]PKY03357.1 hypothetical protein P168DRAFT_305643 [Aspergillus campestris IBT 28561]
MSDYRVIQDSDDEEDPLSEEVTAPMVNAPQDAPGHQADNVGAPPNETHVAGSNQTGPLAVDFDQFLQSQETGPARLSASQQQREARWIPGNAGCGRNGSTIMEIGLAQQRLFEDEDAQHTHHPSPPATGCSESFQSGPDPTDELQLVPDMHAPERAIDTGAVDPNSGSNDTEIHAAPEYPPTVPYSSVPQYAIGPGNGYLNDGTHAYHAPAQNLPQYSSITSDGSSRSAPSYNLFESSLRPSDTYNEGNFAMNTEVTGPTEAQQQSLRRHNSMQAPFWSPHDTEPFSSVASPQASRVKSDGAATIGLQQSQHSADELSAPVSVEVQIPEKKRGRKKKQPVLEDDEDDELAQPIVREPIEQVDKPEKRKPGRPPKNAKGVLDEKATNGTGDTTTTGPVNSDSPSSDNVAKNSTHAGDKVALGEASEKENEPHPARTVQLVEPTEAAVKGNRKKKMKRGKTTSVTVKKTYDSDVEDDVIWVDERPITTSHADPQPNTGTGNAETKPAQFEIVPPPPKKRGRKRKGTTEQVPPDEVAKERRDVVDPGLDGNRGQQNDTDSPVVEPLVPKDAVVSDSHQTSVEPSTVDPSDPLPDPTKEKKENEDAPATPRKAGKVPETPAKGPTKHSPISSTSRVPYRVGLSRRARIAPLLKVVKR